MIELHPLDVVTTHFFHVCCVHVRWLYVYIFIVIKTIFVVIYGFVKTVVFICAHLQAIYIHTNKHTKTIHFSFFSSSYKYYRPMIARIIVGIGYRSYITIIKELSGN